jgi:hypothetical protein
MQKNVIILTSGLSGSSVLAGLIARAGYWTGDETFRKVEYETNENQQLINLNLQLFAEAGYKGNYLVEFSESAIKAVAALAPGAGPSPYRIFLAKCDQHRPWLWKDPRLWLTIRYWKHLLSLEECSFILLTRGTVQSWISSTLRRQITTYRYSKRYEEKIKNSITSFLTENKLPYLNLSYEELIERPAVAIARLNQHLGTSLSVADLQSVYHKPLYKSPRNSWFKSAKAVLIYLRNYSERLDVEG